MQGAGVSPTSQAEPFTPLEPRPEGRTVDRTPNLNTRFPARNIGRRKNHEKLTALAPVTKGAPGPAARACASLEPRCGAVKDSRAWCGSSRALVCATGQAAQSIEVGAGNDGKSVGTVYSGLPAATDVRWEAGVPPVSATLVLARHSWCSQLCRHPG